MPRRPTKLLFTSEQADSVNRLPPWTLAIDPGETCGFAMTFDKVAADVADLGMHYGSGSLPMLEFLDYLAENDHLVALERVIIEEYRIYPDKAMMHSGKTVPTAECIGAIKQIARQEGWPVIEQQAAIKEPMAGLLKGRGFKAVGGNRHAKDAELHLWYYALNPNGRNTNAR